MRYFTRNFNKGSIRYYNTDRFIFGWTINRVQPTELKNFFNKKSIKTLTQVHGAEIKLTSEIGEQSSGDGLILNTPETIGIIRTADCVPLFFWSDQEVSGGILHSGWRSFQKGIAVNLIVDQLKNHNINSFRFFTGPSISGKCYEVDSAVKELLTEKPYLGNFCQKRGKSKYLLDISLGLKYELKNLGIDSNQIELSGICTKCTEGYYSYRQNKTQERIQNFIIFK